MPFCRTGLARNNVKECRFARAVWPDEEAQFSIVDAKSQVVEHLEAIEADAYVFNFQNFSLFRNVAVTGYPDCLRPCLTIPTRLRFCGNWSNCIRRRRFFVDAFRCGVNDFLGEAYDPIWKQQYDPDKQGSHDQGPGIRIAGADLILRFVYHYCAENRANQCPPPADGDPNHDFY